MKQKLLLTLALWLTLLGSAWAKGNALHFNGTNDYVVCPAISPDNFTVEAWVLPTALGKEQAIVSTLNENKTFEAGKELHIGTDNNNVGTLSGFDFLGMKSNWVDGYSLRDVPNEPTISFVSQKNGEISFTVYANEYPIGVDWGDGTLIGYTKNTEGVCNPSSSAYVAGDTVKIYGTGITETNLQSKTGSNEITSLDVSRATELGNLNCDNNKLTQLDVSKNTALDVLCCNNNMLSSLDVSRNTNLSTLFVFNNHLSDINISNNKKIDVLNICQNRLTFATLPTTNGSYSSYYVYAPQDSIDVTAVNGVVDLSSLLTAKDASGNTRTTTYRWLTDNFTELIAGADYTITAPGIFSFVGKPVRFAYCEMTNEAFPDLSGGYELLTKKIVCNSVLPNPAVSLVSENSGDLKFFVGVTENSTVFVDWGNGELMPYNTSSGSTNDLSSSSYVPKQTVKIYGAKISNLNANNQALTALDVSNATELTALYCNGNRLDQLNLSYNSKLNYLDCSFNNLTLLNVVGCNNLNNLLCNNNRLLFNSLPQVKAPYANNYFYMSQANLEATCTNGVVDLSAQLTAVDVGGKSITTAYTWYLAADNSILTNNYMVKDGVFSFYLEPGTKVYCEMYNDAFSDLDLRTADITIDAKGTLPEPSITFVSENSGRLDISVEVIEEGSIYIDWGDGKLTVNSVLKGNWMYLSTSEYVANAMVKVYGTSISRFSADEMGLTALDVSLSTKLETLWCGKNLLTSLDVGNNTALTSLYCFNNQLITLDLTNNTALTELRCNDNKMSFSTLPHAKKSFSYDYYYNPQANYSAVCTNGVVDLNSQLTALDVDRNTQTTWYEWYLADGTPLTATVDYILDHGVSTFVKMPAMAVYCEMVNDAFPGLTLRTVDIQVDKAVKLLPVITWPTPADITYGTPLGNGQLNATANVPGTFSYSPASGTVLEVGSNQILSVTFTPDNTDVYQQVTASVSITVKISTAVRDQESVLVKLCPNPCRDLLMVVSPGQIRRVSFVNLAGQTMLVEEAPTGRIYVASLKPGIYLVKVDDNDGKTTVLRLVKQ